MPRCRCSLDGTAVNEDVDAVGASELTDDVLIAMDGSRFTNGS